MKLNEIQTSTEYGYTSRYYKGIGAAKDRLTVEVVEWSSEGASLQEFCTRLINKSWAYQEQMRFSTDHPLVGMNVAVGKFDRVPDKFVLNVNNNRKVIAVGVFEGNEEVGILFNDPWAV